MFVDYLFALFEVSSCMKTRSCIALHSMADYLDCLVEHLLYFQVYSGEKTSDYEVRNLIAFHLSE